jgi:hypothetical protein
VVEALVSKGILRDRFQLIDGKGSNDPIGDNASTGKAQKS